MRCFPLVLSALFAASSLSAQSPAPVPAPAPKPKLFEFSGTAGFAQTNGNANTLSTNFGDKVKYTAKGWILSQDLAFFYGEADDKVNANFWNGGLRAERVIMKRLGVFAMGRFDRNVLQGVARRFEEGVGLDAKIVVAPKDKLSAQLGASAFQFTATPGSTATGKANYPALRLGADYKHNFSELAYFQQTGEYLPNLSDANAYLFNTESSLVAPLSKRLALKFGYLVRYNSAPPVKSGVQLKTTDTFFSSGITFSY